MFSSGQEEKETISFKHPLCCGPVIFEVHPDTSIKLNTGVGQAARAISLEKNQEDSGKVVGRAAKLLEE